MMTMMEEEKQKEMTVKHGPRDDEIAFSLVGETSTV